METAALMLAAILGSLVLSILFIRAMLWAFDWNRIQRREMHKQRKRMQKNRRA